MPRSSVTFLMAVHNGGPYLLESVESLRSQTVESWRLLLVDDASTDGFVDAVERLADSRITVLRLEANGGQTAALNRGLLEVETPWVSRIDADDRAHPARTEHLLAFLSAHPDCVLVGSFARFVDDLGTPIGVFEPPTSDAEIRTMLRTAPRLNPFAHSAVSYATDAVRSLGGYPSGYEMAEDYALWLQLCEHGSVANIPEFDSDIRIHGAQKTFGRKGLTVYGDLLRAHRRFVAEPGPDAVAIERGRAEVDLHAIGLALRLRLEPAEVVRVVREHQGGLRYGLRHPALPIAVGRRGLRAARRGPRPVVIDWS